MIDSAIQKWNLPQSPRIFEAALFWNNGRMLRHLDILCVDFPNSQSENVLLATKMNELQMTANDIR